VKNEAENLAKSLEALNLDNEEQETWKGPKFVSNIFKHQLFQPVNYCGVHSGKKKCLLIQIIFSS